MSADLEREELAEVAREVACEKVGQCFTQGTDVMLIARAVKAAKYAYLAAATLREEEIEGQRHFFNLATEEIATLRARVEELEGMVPKWVPKGEGKIAPLVEMGWQGVCDSPDEWQRLMVPPIPVPETKVNASQQGA